MRRRGSRAWGFALAGALVAACSSAPASPSGPPTLAAGTYTSRSFQPPVTFTVPGGWTNPEDQPAFFSLQPAANRQAGIYLFRDPQPASQDPTCPMTAEPGVGSTSLALVAWIRALDGLVVSAPRLVTVGGLRGTEIDVNLEPDWTASCPFAGGLPTVPLFIGSAGTVRWVVVGSERLRLSILDVPGGGTVVVDIDAFVGSDWDQLLAEAIPIVAGLSFATR